MTYAHAVRWLESRVNCERSGASLRWRRLRNLDRIRRLLAAVGNPHLPGPESRVPGPRSAQGRRWTLDLGPSRPGVRPRFIHIAGTKGKGSTAHLLAAALQGLGFRVGLYTSPHLVHLRERVRIDGVPIAPARLAAHLTRLRRALAGAGSKVRSPQSKVRGHATVDVGLGTLDPPTYFDLLTAAAFLEFRGRRVDWAVMETGLGGRLDSTNVVDPAVTVLTNVDFDHMDVLGNTLSSIALEKAGIVKPGVPLVCGRLASAAARPVERAARFARSPVWRAGRELGLADVRSSGLAGVRFFARTPGRRWWNVGLAVAGRHQAENALLAIGVLDRLEADGLLRVDPARVRRALAAAAVPGRLQVVRHPLTRRPVRRSPRRGEGESFREGGIPSPCPLLVIDVAHNGVSARALAAALRTGRGLPPRERRVLLFAAAREKPARAMLSTLARVTGAAVLVRVSHPRMRGLDDLLAVARGLWPVPPVGADSPETGLRLARALAGPRGLVIVAGSFHLAGAVLAGEGGTPA